MVAATPAAVGVALLFIGLVSAKYASFTCFFFFSICP